MIELYGPENPQTRFIENLLNLKGVHFARLFAHHPSEPDHDGPILKDNKLVIMFAPVITQYINERYPYPDIEPEDPEKRAITQILCTKVLKGKIATANIQAYLKHRRPFILGSKLSLLDLAIEPIATDPLYTEDIKRYAKAAQRGVL